MGVSETVEKEFAQQVNEAVECLELGKKPPSSGNYEAMLAALWLVVGRLCKEDKKQEEGRG